MRKFICFLLLSLPCAAQLTSGVIDSSRTIDWTSAGVVGGIPTRSTICSTLGTAGQAPSFAQSVTAANINSAITGCASNEVVLLNPGTYSITASINLKSNVTLRGSGANQTLLVVPAGGYSGGACSAIVCFTSDSNTYSGASTVQPGGSNAATWTAGFTQGTTNITLTSVGSNGLSVGKYIILDQANVASPTGNMFFCDTNPTTCSIQPGNGFRVVSGVDHGIAQMVQITACSPSCTSGSTFTISPGLYGQNWSSSNNPGAWWPSSTVQNAGIENLTIDDRLDTGNSSSLNISFFNSANDWATGLATYLPGRSHIQLADAAHITIMNNYAWGTKNALSSSYGHESFLTSDNLIVNNIYQQVSSPQMTQLDTGTVRAYNYDILDLFCQNGTQCNSPSGAPNTTPGGPLGLTTTNHNPGVMDVLWEGNITPGYKSDDVHGSGGMSTYFRNQVYGWSAGSANANNDGFWNWAFAALSYNRALSIVGNVIGKPGFASVYQGTDTTSNTTGEIYDLGWGDGVTNDTTAPSVASTLLRWGNWDAKTNAVRWCGNSSDTGWSTTCSSTSEIPTAIGTYQSAVPTLGDTGAGQSAMPASFAFSSKPSFIPAAKPWPLIGPDVTGGNLLVCTSGTYNGYLVVNNSQCAGGTSAMALGGMVNSIPAMDCYLNTMSGTPDGSGTTPNTNFNASSCYSAIAVATPTAAPGAGSYTGTQAVTLTTSTGGSILCYTTNGTTPTATTAGTCTNGITLANGGTISVGTTSTVMVIGTQVGFTNSAVGSYAYTITPVTHSTTFNGKAVFSQSVVMN